MPKIKKVEKPDVADEAEKPSKKGKVRKLFLVNSQDELIHTNVGGDLIDIPAKGEYGPIREDYADFLIGRYPWLKKEGR